MQAIQKVFMAEEWVKDTRNKARLTDNLHAETSKALGTVEERRRKSVEADLKNAQDQVKEQCKKLHYIEIELATAKQEVLDLKAELKKAKEAARVAKAATNASKQKFYDLEV